MKKITYYLQGKAHEYIPDVRYRMLQHKNTKDFWTFEYTMNKIREFKGKPDWHIATKYISRARKASRWRRSERLGFIID